MKRLLLASLPAGLLLLLLVCGCKSHYSPGFVYRDWSARMNEMGIFTFYPPREDVVVGDVYAVPLHPYDNATVGYIGGLGNAGIHVSYLGDTRLGWSNLLTRLNDYYQTRPYPADTGTNIVGEGTNSLPLSHIPGYPDATNRSTAFGPGSTARLRQVSFPDFSVSTVDQASLAAVVPIEAIMASLQFSYSDIKAVHFKISQAESYGLTTEELLADVYKSNLFTNYGTNILMLGTQDGVLSVAGAQMANAMFRRILHTLETDPEHKLPLSIRKHVRASATAMADSIYLALVSEVYYARAIDITIDRKSATGGGATARPVSSDELAKLVKLGLTKLHNRGTNACSTTGTAAGTNSPAGTTASLPDLTEGDTALELAKKMRNINTPSGVENIGASVEVLSVSAGNIGLRRIFERPIAVGVRGVLVKVEVNHPVLLDGKPWMRVESFGVEAR